MPNPDGSVGHRANEYVGGHTRRERRLPGAVPSIWHIDHRSPLGIRDDSHPSKLIHSREVERYTAGEGWSPSCSVRRPELLICALVSLSDRPRQRRRRGSSIGVEADSEDQRSTTQRMSNLSVAMPLGVPLMWKFTLYRSPSALLTIAVCVSAKWFSAITIVSRPEPK